MGFKKGRRVVGKGGSVVVVMVEREERERGKEERDDELVAFRFL